jgi:hypothetical protein
MQTLTPIPANVAAIWGAFLYEGILVCSQDNQRETAVLKQWHQGCVELMAAACAFLPEVWRQIEPRWYEAQFPGVFEYEVIAPLGVIIGDYILLHHGSLPPRAVVREFVEELIGDFFRGHHAIPVYEHDKPHQTVSLH